jgi:ATP-binding cassette subfamily B protein
MVHHRSLSLGGCAGPCCSDADRILVVDRGHVVETGRHDEPLARGGAYARLHRSRNSTVMDTVELRMPLFPEYPARPASY